MIALAFVWISCSEEENDPSMPKSFDGGVFVLNEGNFGSANASLSYFEPVSKKVYSAQYNNASGQDLGDVLQSGHINDNLLFLVVNNSNKVIALDLDNQLSEKYILSGVQQPRYLTTSGSKGYVTETVSYAEKGKLSVFDLTSGEVTNTIAMDYQPEGVLKNGDQLFVSNNGSANVFVVSLSTEEVTDTISVGSSPGQMVVDQDGDIWIVCAGGYDQNWDPANDGAFYEIDPTTLQVKKSIELGANISGKIAISPAGDEIYYHNSGSIYVLQVDAQSAPQTAFTSVTSFYGIGVSGDGTIYVADASDYVQNGSVYRYETNGTLLDEFETGLLPGGLIFN